MSRILKLKNKMNMKNLIKYGFIAVVMLSFVSCGTRVENYEWEWAEEVCKDRKGVRYYNADTDGCRCNDGEWVHND